jgi:plastocyanin
MRRLLPALVLAIAAAALAAGCGGSSKSSAGTDTPATDTTATDTTTATTAGGASGKLSGSVGPGFDISMDRKTVPAGTYTLTVNDKGDIHNFHLKGAGVDVKTDVAGTGITTFTVTLQPGTYTFVCDPHSSSMKGTLKVT